MSLERSCMKAARPWEAQWRQREKRYFSHSVAIYTHNMYQSCSAAAQYSVRINVVPICPSPFAEKSGYLPWFYLQYYQHLKNNYCLSTHVLRQFCCFSVPWCIPSLYQYWLKKEELTFLEKLSSSLLSMVLFVPAWQNRVHQRKVITYFGSYS